MKATKPCKGINKAHGFESCGKEVKANERKFGLCRVCYFDWMTETESGKIHYLKQFLPKVKVKVETIKKERKTASKIDLMSADEYRSKYLQPEINKIARLIDYGNPCIATGNYGKMNGGHYISVGANRTICLNLHNIFIQSFSSNHWKSGDPIKYQNGLIETFGKDYFEFVSSLSQHKPLHLSKSDMIEIRKKAKEIIKTIEEKHRTPKQRIELRNEINTKLGIYDLKFSVY